MVDLNVVSVPAPERNGSPPLLFVHGAWHGAWCWELFQQHFSAAGWDTHAVDLRGHGESPNDRSLRLTRIKHYVEDVARAVAALDEEPILIAHSMGGLVVQRFLESTTLPGAVLVAPVPVGGVTRATFRTLRRHPLAFLKANLTWNLWPLVQHRETAADLFLPDDSPEADIDWLTTRLQAESYLAYLDMLFVTRPRPQLVHSPVRIVAGEHDRIFGLAQERKTALAYGHEAAVIEGGAHDLMLGPRWESAADAVAAALNEILDE